MNFESDLSKGECLTVEFKSWIKTSGIKECINLVTPELVAFSNILHLHSFLDGTVCHKIVRTSKQH